MSHHQRRAKLRRLYLMAALVLLLVLLCAGFSFAQQAEKVGGRIIVCMIQLEHADAEYLATVLKPFLSPQGSIVPYKTTNTLIIKDRAPVVNTYVERFRVQRAGLKNPKTAYINGILSSLCFTVSPNGVRRVFRIFINMVIGVHRLQPLNLEP